MDSIRRASPVLRVASTCLSFVLCLSCTPTPKPVLSPVSPGGVTKVAVTFTGGRVDVDINPVVACFLGNCTPKTTQIHWEISTGEKLDVKFNPSYEGKPCQTWPAFHYKRNPGLSAIRCEGPRCETVGRPGLTGCFKYDVTVTPLTGPPVTLDPDMIIM